MTPPKTCPFCIGHACQCGYDAAPGLPADVRILAGRLPPRPPVPALDAFLARIAALPIDPPRRKAAP